MLSGLNHLTLAVSQLAPSVAFLSAAAGHDAACPLGQRGLSLLRRFVAVPVAGSAAARYPAGGERLHPLCV